MLRLTFLAALMPTFAAADLVPHPSMFTYDVTFELCTAEPDLPDLRGNCTHILQGDYVLARAVARAVQACYPDPLDTCAMPFEDEGLPAIAARIAVSSGCDETDLRTLVGTATLDPNHCAIVITDILRDEGVVPLDETLTCDANLTGGNECYALASIGRKFWSDIAASTVSGPRAAEHAQAVADAYDFCSEIAPPGAQGWVTRDIAIENCEARRYSEFWQMNRQPEGDN